MRSIWNKFMRDENRLLFLILAGLSLTVNGSFAVEEKSPSAAITAAQALKFSGYAQFLSTTQSAGTDGASLRRARFVLSGEILKNVKFKAQIDAVKSPILVEAQIDWAPSAAVGVRLGQFRVPFSQESLTSSADLDLANRSQVVSKIAPGQDIGASGRDIGLAVVGKVGVLEYIAGLFNGTGINKTDTNNQKDVAVRAVLRPFPALALGASAYRGRYSASAGSPVSVRDRIGIESALSLSALAVKAEYIRAEDGAISKSGWYVQGGWMFIPKRLQGVLKFDSYDKDRGFAGDRSDVLTAGINWFFAEKTKLLVNTEIYRTEDGHTVNRVFLIQFQIGY